MSNRSMSYLTPEAKSKLSATIRSLRQRLLEDLQNAGEGTFRLSIKAANQAGLTEANRVKRQRLEQWVEMQVRGETAGKKLKEEQRRSTRIDRQPHPSRLPTPHHRTQNLYRSRPTVRRTGRAPSQTQRPPTRN